MSKRKGHSAEKRHAAMSRAILKNIVVVFTQYNSGCLLAEVPSGKVVRATESIVSCINHPYQWSVFMAVFCENAVKGKYMKGSVMNTSERYYHSDLADVLTAHHQALIDSVNPDDLKSVGQIASPMGKTFEPEEAEKLFDKLGAWEV